MVIPVSRPAVELKAQETREERILDAALSLFAERGFHGTSIPLVLERAGVGASALYRRFQRTRPAERVPELWGRRWALGALYSGLTWGSSALFMFDPGNANYQAYLVICLVGVTAGALALVTIDLRSFFMFVVPTLLPITLRLVAEADRLHLWMAAVCSLVLCVLIKFGLKLNRELESWCWGLREEDD